GGNLHAAAGADLLQQSLQEQDEGRKKERFSQRGDRADQEGPRMAAIEQADRRPQGSKPRRTKRSHDRAPFHWRVARKQNGCSAIILGRIGALSTPERVT